MLEEPRPVGRAVALGREHGNPETFSIRRAPTPGTGALASVSSCRWRARSRARLSGGWRRQPCLRGCPDRRRERCFLQAAVQHTVRQMPPPFAWPAATLSMRWLARDVMVDGVGGNRDSEAVVGDVPALFTQGGPTYGQAPQSRHVPDARSGEAARAGGAVLQTTGSSSQWWGWGWVTVLTGVEKGSRRGRRTVASERGVRYGRDGVQVRVCRLERSERDGLPIALSLWSLPPWLLLLDVQKWSCVRARETRAPAYPVRRHEAHCAHRRSQTAGVGEPPRKEVRGVPSRRCVVWSRRSRRSRRCDRGAPRGTARG